MPKNNCKGLWWLVPFQLQWWEGVLRVSLTARIPTHLLELLTASVHNTASHVDLTVLADSDQLVWVLQQDDVRRFSRILLSFLDLFPGVRNDSSQCIWPRGARTGCQRGCHHQTGVAWWKNRREKDRWDDERPGFTLSYKVPNYLSTYLYTILHTRYILLQYSISHLEDKY